MSFLSTLAIIIFVGYAVMTNVIGKPVSTDNGKPEVMSEVDVAETSATPSGSIMNSPRPTPRQMSSPKSESTIKISVDDGESDAKAEIIVYPGAASFGSGEYQTSASGEEVYNWYKQELEKRNYNIRNNVKTRANDLFKAVLQGASAQISIKVSIEQENASAKTKIHLE